MTIVRMENRVYTLAQLAQHVSNKDCWIVVHGRVLDVTKFLGEHPGGEDVLLEVAGKDATSNFQEVGHSNAAQNMLVKYQVGILQGFKIQEDTTKEIPDQQSKPRSNDIPAYVIKEEDEVSKFAALFEVFGPLSLSLSVFAYRYFTRQIEMNNL